MSIFVSSTLSVSKKEKLNCEEMAEYLGKLGIVTLVSSNISAQPQKEYGCQLTQSITSKNDIKKIWNIIQNKYNFKCGHLSVGNSFNGCILNYLAPSKCNADKEKYYNNVLNDIILE